jgi:hypothetical protein
LTKRHLPRPLRKMLSSGTSWAPFRHIPIKIPRAIASFIHRRQEIFGYDFSTSYRQILHDIPSLWSSGLESLARASSRTGLADE